MLFLVLLDLLSTSKEGACCKKVATFCCRKVATFCCRKVATFCCRNVLQLFVAGMCCNFMLHSTRVLQPGVTRVARVLVLVAGEVLLSCQRLVGA